MTFLAALLLVSVTADAMPDSMALDTLNLNWSFESWDSCPPRKNCPSHWVKDESSGWLEQWDGRARHGRFSVLPISCRFSQVTKIYPPNDSMYRACVWCSTSVIGGSVGGWLYLTEYYTTGSSCMRSKMVFFDGSNTWQEFGFPWKETPYNLDSVLMVIDLGCSSAVDVACVLVRRPVHSGVNEEHPERGRGIRHKEAAGGDSRPRLALIDHRFVVVKEHAGRLYDCKTGRIVR